MEGSWANQLNLCQIKLSASHATVDAAGIALPGTSRIERTVRRDALRFHKCYKLLFHVVMKGSGCRGFLGRA